MFIRIQCLQALEKLTEESNDTEAHFEVGAVCNTGRELFGDEFPRYNSSNPNMRDEFHKIMDTYVQNGKISRTKIKRTTKPMNTLTGYRTKQLGE
jgi:hypothetical protein